MARAWALVALCLSCPAAVAPAQVPAHDAAEKRPLLTHAFDVGYNCEIVATLRARCSGCSWGIEGHEAAALIISVDGGYSQHLLLARGEELSDYRVSLGSFAAGRHALQVGLDPSLSAAHIGTVSVSLADIRETFEKRPLEQMTSSPRQVETRNFIALSRAPILHARANTVGRFTDLPVIMWYEVVPTAGGRQFRYSVIFTNEDGGTPTDRLVATWGRTTDIEFVYGVELDDNNAVISEEYQARGHEVPKFTGRHEGRHPLLWVATDNNMVSEEGTTIVRYRLVPEFFELRYKSREVVMDAHPWTYTVAAAELAREGKIADDATPGSGRIPDPRHFVFVEACSELTDAALAFSIRAKDASGAESWYDSDRGIAEFRIVRAGCFRAGVPLPPHTGPPDAIRFHAMRRQSQSGDGVPAPVAVTRINKVFTLGGDYTPGPPLFAWIGWIELPATGEWRELAF
jgi:hypothetical protein